MNKKVKRTHMAQRTTRPSIQKRKTVAKKKPALRSSNSFFRFTPKIKLIGFVALFALMGIAALWTLRADSKFSTAADEVVFQYTNETGPSVLTSASESSEQRVHMRLTGDGELLCRDNTTVTLKQGKLNAQQVSKLYDEISKLGLDGVEVTPDSREQVMLPEGYEVLLVNGSDGVLALPSHNSAGEQIELFYKATERLMRECDKADKGIKKQDIREVKTPKKIKQTASLGSKIAQLLFPTAEAATGKVNSGKSTTPTAVGFNATEEASMDSKINDRRAAVGLNRLAGSACLKDYARNWAQYMASLGAIPHSNVKLAFNSPYCTMRNGDRPEDKDWVGAGEIVGNGGDTTSIFNAYMASACHKAVIEGYLCGSPSVKYPYQYVATGTYVTSDGRLWTATLVVDCGTNTACNDRMRGGTTTTPPPSTSYDNASCAALNAPSTLTAGANFSATVTMYNAGTVTWTLGSTNGTWRLGSSNPRDNVTWNVNRVNGSGTVAPGGTAYFTISGRAPSPGTTTNYTFNWEMVKEGAYWLHDQPDNPNVPNQAPICGKVITVSPAATSVTCKRQINFTTLYASPSTYDGPTIQTVDAGTEMRYYYYKYANPVFYNHQISSVLPGGGTYIHNDGYGLHGIQYDYQVYFNQSADQSVTPQVSYSYIYTYQGALWVQRVNKSTGTTTYQQSSGDGVGGTVTDDLTVYEQKYTPGSYVYGPTVNRSCQ